MATRTGLPLRRSFCVDCGSSVFLSPGHPDLADVVGIASGTIDDVEGEEQWGMFVLQPIERPF